VITDEGLNFSQRVVVHSHPPFAPRALARRRVARSSHHVGQAPFSTNRTGHRACGIVHHVTTDHPHSIPWRPSPQVIVATASHARANTRHAAATSDTDGATLP
jgi:hypothetical protein